MSGTEDYLDGLLNSLSEKDMDAEKETGSKTMRTEDDIMNEMENDLLSKEAEDNFLEQFEKELANEKSAPEAETKDDFFNSLDQIVDGTGQNNKEDDFMMDTLGDIPGIDDIMKKEEPAQTSEPQTDEKEESGQQENTKAPENLGGLGDLDGLGDFGISDDISDDISEESADVTEGAQMTDYTDKGESDALGMEDAASDGLDDFGDLGEADIFGDDGAGESENTSDSMSDVMPNDREDKPKKESFLKKLSRILFGEDDEDEAGDPASSGKELITEENAGDIDLSDPNMQILQELGDIPGISDAPKEEEKSDPEEDKKKKKAIDVSLININNNEKKEVNEMTKTMNIKGMMCGHCEAAVKKALEALPEVASAEVSHEKGTAVVTLEKEIADDVLKKTVEDKDYEVVEIK